jgi:hypothetical protein
MSGRDIKMWQLLVLLIISLPCVVRSLEPFDPWVNNDSACKSSMASCTFQLQAKNAMTMFYKDLFRVVATDNGTLQKYDNPNEIFHLDRILTGDGYPKLVRNTYLLNQSCSLLDRYMYSIILFLVR